jgi:hypothetical protein
MLLSELASTPAQAGGLTGPGQARPGMLLGRNMPVTRGPSGSLAHSDRVVGGLGPGYLRGTDELESSYARIDRCDTAQPSK